MPFFAKLPVAATAIGVARAIAQGQATTNTAIE